MVVRSLFRINEMTNEQILELIKLIWEFQRRLEMKFRGYTVIEGRNLAFTWFNFAKKLNRNYSKIIHTELINPAGTHWQN